MSNFPSLSIYLNERVPSNPRPFSRRQSNRPPRLSFAGIIDPSLITLELGTHAFRRDTGFDIGDDL